MTSLLFCFLPWYLLAWSPRQRDSWDCAMDMERKASKSSLVFLVWGLFRTEIPFFVLFSPPYTVPSLRKPHVKWKPGGGSQETLKAQGNSFWPKELWLKAYVVGKSPLAVFPLFVLLPGPGAQTWSQDACSRAGRLKAPVSSWRTRGRAALKTGEPGRNHGEREAWEMDPTGSRVWLWPQTASQWLRHYWADHSDFRLAPGWH